MLSIFMVASGGVIARPRLVTTLRAALRRSPVVALIGPRQCGKTAAARWLVPADSPRYFDLEDPASLARLDQPMTALGPLRGLVAIDEIQRRPDLFPIPRVLADRWPVRSRPGTRTWPSDRSRRRSSISVFGSNRSAGGSFLDDSSASPSPALVIASRYG